MLELGDPGRRIGTVEHAVAEFRGELAEDRHPVQERARVLVERRENLAAQVLGHEPVVSPERPHGPHRIIDGPQPQPGKDERSRPPLGARHEHADLLRGELEPAESHEQLVRFSGGERKLGSPDLDQRVRGPQPRESQRRIDPCEKHKVHVRREVGERVVN